ncbi:MDIS1-interacting receptor like kinase [Sesamum angolense]|uniref:non-specific serine/threonine protein kinase n=1 Tax=Sesamum angolense TaxID=2727404 RepID=A0AAE2BJT2_9LAMI|nr:MDIS1-interacting receptor like kinase [Sesamum angolense]
MASLFAVCFPIISTVILLIIAPSQTTTANTEAEALISSGWWSSHYTRNISDHCKWAGVACDDAGHVVEIGPMPTTVPIDAWLGPLDKLNFLALPHLVRIELRGLRLYGTIPAQIGTITSAFGSIGTSGYNEVLLLVNLSHNNLSGAIPRALFELGTVDLSYNALEGPIPIDIRCELPKCVLFPNGNLFNYSASTTSSNKEASNTNYTLIFVLVAVFFGLLFLGGGFFLLKIKAKKSNEEPLVTNEGDIFKIWNFNGKIAYEDIVKATEDFEISYCIGTGGYGSVYRAELPNGRVVALKKLHRMEGENPIYDKCFRNEAKSYKE